MNILITGGAGFIGSHIVDLAWMLVIRFVLWMIFLLDHGIILLRHKTIFALTVCEGNICDEEPNVIYFFRNFVPDVVYHLSTDQCPWIYQNPKHDVEVNILWTLNILQAMRELHCQRIIFSSTGGSNVFENTPHTLRIKVPSPIDPYGISKRTIELHLAFYERQYGIRSTILRYANVYWPRQNAWWGMSCLHILEKLK